MKPTYSTTHMLMNLRKRFRRVLDLPSDAVNGTIGDVLNSFGRAEKFLLPQDGLLFDDTDAKHFVKFFKLPFPAVVLEYEGTTGNYRRKPRDNYEAVKVILLAMEANLQSRQSRMDLNYDDKKEKDGAIVCVAYSQEANPKEWLLIPATIYIPYGSQAQEFAADINKIIVGVLYPLMDIDEDAQDFATCTSAVIKESLSLFHFCSALNCSNVTYDTVKAPKFINSKRKAKGELPLYEYKILTVDTRARHVDTGEVLSTGRKHASPRQHIRRGHIRHYKSGKNVWIQQMTVGDPAKGRIDKDYKVKASTGFTPGASPKS